MEDISESLDGGGLVMADVGEWCRRGGIFEDAKESLSGMDGDVSGVLVRDLGVLREKFHGVCDAFCLGVVGKDAVATIMLHRRAEVPAVNAVWIPGAALLWFFVEDDFGAGGCHGSAVEVEIALKDLVCREVWVAS